MLCDRYALAKKSLKKIKTGKFQVSVERVVNLGNYESLRVGLAEVLDLGGEKPEDAYARILQKVDGWTKHLKPAKSAREIVKISQAAQPAIRTDDPYLSYPGSNRRRGRILKQFESHRRR